MLVQCVGILVPALGVNFGSHDLVLRAACQQGAADPAEGDGVFRAHSTHDAQEGPEGPSARLPRHD